MNMRAPSRFTGLWVTAAPFAVIGTACIIAGGLIAAVTAHSPSRQVLWMVAFLVLVAGVAQIALGVAQALLAVSAPARRVVMAELVAYNAGSALVLAGTLSGWLLLTDVGGALLSLALVLLFRGVRGSSATGRWTVTIYRALIAIVLLSVPVGLVIAHVRAA